MQLGSVVNAMCEMQKHDYHITHFQDMYAQADELLHYMDECLNEGDLFNDAVSGSQMKDLAQFGVKFQAP